MTFKSSMKKISFSLLSLSTILSACSSQSNILSNDSVKANYMPGFEKFMTSQNEFQWGVSTAGHQSEGYDTTSIWHQWDKDGKTIHNNPRGVDFLNKYQEDVSLAKGLGANGFRFSIEWSRIEPRNGYFDPQGIQFYRNLINEIKAKGMTPLVTLVHFNYPQWILNENKASRKGVESPEFVDYFLRYTDKVVREFGNDIKYWITFNEPNIWIPGAYLTGQTPPGKKNPFATVRATWNLLKAHSKAYDLIHQLDMDAMVSSNVFYILPKPFGATTPAPNTLQIKPKNIDEKNILDTDWFYESINTGNVTVNPQAIYEGQIQASSNQSISLSQELSKTDSRNKPKSGDINIEMDSQVSWLKKFDYVAFDYYYRFKTVNQVINLAKPWLMEIYPQGLYDAIMYYHRKYNKPILIAENGIATEDLKTRNDRWTREASIVEHIKYMKKAMADGANVIGYYHWSITDNYEWGTFTPRFGLYTVDALNDPDMKRVPTPAVEVYKEIIKNNGVTPELTMKFKDPNLQGR
jgi:beta-glucosidase